MTIDQRKLVISGAVLLDISLAVDEIASISLPSNFFISVSRQAFLPSLYSLVQNHFHESIVATER